MRKNRMLSRTCRGNGGAVTVVGAVLAAAGLLLLFLCIPGWAWAALAGAALVAAGWLLIRTGQGGR